MQLFRNAIKKLLAPPEKPIRTSAEVYEHALARQQDLVKKVKLAKENIAMAKRRLETSIAAGQKNLSDLEAQGLHSVFFLQLYRVAFEETQSLEQEVEEIGQDEKSLASIELRLTAQLSSIATQKDARDARSNAVDARRGLFRALEDVPNELDNLGATLRQVEVRTERVQRNASVVEQLMENRIMKTPGLAIGDPSMSRLAADYVGRANTESDPKLKRRMIHGLMILLDVSYESEQLKTALSAKKTTDRLAAEISDLIDETDKKTVSVLERALELMKNTGSANPEAIEAELRKEAEALQAAAQIQASNKQEKLMEAEEHLRIIKQQQAMAEELLDCVLRCKTDLNGVRVRLQAVHSGGNQENMQAAADTLRKTVADMARVQNPIPNAPERTH